MFKKLINKIIMGTKCYMQLKEGYEKHIDNNKSIARKIIRAINKKDNKLVKELCNQIIKGE